MEHVDEPTALVPTLFVAATVPLIEQEYVTVALAPPEETLACVHEQLSAEADRGIASKNAKNSAIFKYFIAK